MADRKNARIPCVVNSGRRLDYFNGLNLADQVIKRFPNYKVLLAIKLPSFSWENISLAEAEELNKEHFGIIRSQIEKLNTFSISNRIDCVHLGDGIQEFFTKDAFKNVFYQFENLRNVKYKYFDLFYEFIDDEFMDMLLDVKPTEVLFRVGNLQTAKDKDRLLEVTKKLIEHGVIVSIGLMPFFETQTKNSLDILTENLEYTINQIKPTKILIELPAIPYYIQGEEAILDMLLNLKKAVIEVYKKYPAFCPIQGSLDTRDDAVRTWGVSPIILYNTEAKLTPDSIFLENWKYPSVLQATITDEDIVIPVPGNHPQTPFVVPYFCCGNVLFDKNRDSYGVIEEYDLNEDILED